MLKFNGQIRPYFNTLAKAMTFLACGLCAVAAPDRADAQQFRPHVIMNDRGGLLENRLRELGHLRDTHAQVEIRGSICYSTCTMYLGLPDVCVSQKTKFGFHGPTSFGRKLTPVLFENASRMIAAHYPEPLRRWYLEEGRYRTKNLYYIRGRELIQMGVKSC
ncbi:hypothetical protein IV417_12670 [Alphaproteobacteria bacterium KMM 3653]|uniref:Uncharacterized protein n=1 Tax=Harenicola maris TaxID=2841044 RepID=A0AAP2G4S6_9RHOB|nr:hypothetical protein [Harenicola maris]